LIKFELGDYLLEWVVLNEDNLDLKKLFRLISF